MYDFLLLNFHLNLFAFSMDFKIYDFAHHACILRCITVIDVDTDARMFGMLILQMQKLILR